MHPAPVPYSRPLKTASAVALAALLCLLVLSLVFWKERMLFADAPHILFNIINSGSLQIQEHRYGSFMTQALPWLGLKMGLSLKGLMLLYSASFPLFYLGAACLLHFAFRQYRFSILLAAYHVLLSTQSFYWSNNEIHQGVTWMLLWMGSNAWLSTQGVSALLRFCVFAALGFLALQTHPLVMLTAVFLWGFLWLENRLPFDQTGQKLLATAILLFCCYWKYRYSSRHGYDSGLMDRVHAAGWGAFKDALKGPIVRGLLSGWHASYLMFWTTTIAGLVLLIRIRKWRLLLWTGGFIIAYLLLLGITYPEFSRFYIESEWQGLGLIAATPWVYYGGSGLHTRAGLAGIGIVLFVQLCLICGAASPFRERVQLTEQVLHLMKEKGMAKAVIADTNARANRILQLNWASPVESLFLSALAQEHPQRSFTFAAPALLPQYLATPPDQMLENFSTRSRDRLNGHYFYPDSLQHYQLLNVDTLVR